MKWKKYSGDGKKQGVDGKKIERKTGKHPGFWALLLTAALVAEMFSGMTFVTDWTQLHQMEAAGAVSANGSFQQSEEFQQILDGYLQCLKLYMKIRSMAGGEEETLARSVENLPFLESCSDSTDKLSMEQAAKLPGHNFDYEGYLKTYLDDFPTYCEAQLGIYELVKHVFSLQNVYFTIDGEDGKVYTLAGNSQPISAGETLKKQAKAVPKQKKYEGLETLLPSLETGEQEDSVIALNVQNVSLEIPQKTAYARWLWKEYPEYARAWTIEQLADACENGFEGTAADGTQYSAYREAALKLYRTNHCITDMYALAEISTEDGRKTLKIKGDNASMRFAHRTISIDVDDTLYYNTGSASFTAADFLEQQDAYFGDAADSDQYRVYDISMRSFEKELRSLEKSWEKVADEKPWKQAQPLCSEVTAADLAQFCLSYCNGLEVFLEDSGFVFEVKAGTRYLASNTADWRSFVSEIQKSGRKQTKNEKSYLYAYFDTRGTIYNTNLYWKGFENSGNLKQYMESMAEPYSNAVCAIGVDMDQVKAAGGKTVLGELYRQYVQEQEAYRTLCRNVQRDVVLLSLGALLIFAAFLMWGKTIIQQKKSGAGQGKIAGVADRIPVEMAVLAACVACIVCVDVLRGWYRLCRGKITASDTLQTWDYELWMADFAWLAAAAALAAFAVMLFAWRLYGRTLSGHSALLFAFRRSRQGICAGRQTAKQIREAYRGSGAPLRYGIMMTVFLLICAAGGALCLDVSPGMTLAQWILFVLYMAALLMIGEGVLAAGLRHAVMEELICQGARRIAQGEISYQLPLPEKAGREQRALVETINHIREGLETAVEESTRSERMKSELITNVSHDIKTPLTSIINYVDLLKREDFENARAREYLTVLEQKAFRLKGLIEDLIEASKAASGAITLQITNLNFTELISQTEGEFEERMEEAGLSLVTDLPEDAVYFRGDGRRVYRILENLYGNVVKYAMTGTRVYTSLSIVRGVGGETDRAVFSIKNISRDPLNMSPQELTERFVRGDAARASEGSGLGLYIASNLTERMDGTFEIYMDGDLFRVTVAFPTESPDL